jgi:drug/metabolite transporter (DMT)-like permease
MSELKLFRDRGFWAALALVGIVGTGVYWTFYFAVSDQPALIVKKTD